MPVQTTDIVWTDYSANQWRGCAKVSEGCMNCWAASMADRFDRTPEPWTVDNIDANLQVYDEDVSAELTKKEAGWCFYPSSSDPFLPWLEKETAQMYVESLRWNDHLCFQVLTKWGPENDRAEQDATPDQYVPQQTAPSLPDNVMLGVSCESPLRTYRIDWLREQDAEMKFVSFEPLVEAIGDVDLSGIDWIIVGGESHQNPEERREMEPEWARHLYQQAEEQDVAFLFKQHSGQYAEQKVELCANIWKRGVVTAVGGPRKIREFPETPRGLPDAPKEFLNG